MYRLDSIRLEICCGVVWCGVVWCGVVWCIVVFLLFFYNDVLYFNYDTAESISADIRIIPLATISKLLYYRLLDLDTI